MSFFDVKKEIKTLKTTLNESGDFSHRYFIKGKQTVGFVFIKSIINQDLLSEAVYKPFQAFDGELSIDIIKNFLLKSSDV